jgi:hypothetical protein
MTKIRNERGESSGGVGLLGLVFIVFLALKLGEIGSVADWSWWAVTAPLWVPAIIIGVFALIGGIFAGIVWLFESQQARQRRKARAALAELGRATTKQTDIFGGPRGRR